MAHHKHWNRLLPKACRLLGLFIFAAAAVSFLLLELGFSFPQGDLSGRVPQNPHNKLPMCPAEVRPSANSLWSYVNRSGAAGKLTFFEPRARFNDTHSYAFECHERGCGSTRGSLNFLKGRWIFLSGDSQMRQVYESLQRLVTGGDHVDFNVFKESVRSQCSPQTHREKYIPPPDSRMPCWKNEKTCESSWTIGEATLNVTFDWKHFTLESREEYLYGDGGYFQSLGSKAPDVVVVGLGAHICAHTLTPTAANKPELRQQFIADIPRLIDLMDSHYQGATIWLAPGPYVWGPADSGSIACMANVSSAIRRAVKGRPSHYVVARDQVYKDFGVWGGSLAGLHVPEVCIDATVEYLVGLLRCLLVMTV